MQVRLYGSEVEKTAQRQEDQARLQKGLVDASDFGRNSLSSVLTSGVTAAAHGRSFWDAAKGALSGIGDQLMAKGISGAVGSIFGGPGTVLGSGGLFGGSPAMRGGFGSYGPQLPGSGGFLSSILGTFFGGAHATGGPIVGPGSGTSDSILARVSNGEYVMRAAAVDHYGSNIMDRLNGLSMPKFADGGLVGAPDGQPMVTVPAGPQVGIGGSGGAPMSGRGNSGHTFNFGDTHIHPVGGAQFTDDQVRQISAQVQAGQQRTIDHITRNLPEIQFNNRQY